MRPDEEASPRYGRGTGRPMNDGTRVRAHAPRNVLIAGVPRSGTTWIGKTLGEAPGVRYLHEPDNWRVDPMAWIGMRGTGSRPSYSVGERAPDYHRMWELAFAGGWPEDNARIDELLRLARSQRLPRALRLILLRRAARAAIRQASTSDERIVIKSVFATLTVEWIASEFDTEVVIVWRHPLNIVPSWIERGWTDARAMASAPAFKERFDGSGVWPPPVADDVQGVAWAVCAYSTMMIETAARNDAWPLISHERLSMEPIAGFRELFARLDIPWTSSVEAAILGANRPGSGFETNRIAADEAMRWRARLSSEDQARAVDIVRTFERVSPAAAALWPTSPAVKSDAGANPSIP